jgi:hypothetical protein
MFKFRRPIIKMFGSKFSIAHKYPPPKFGMICEPFAGGAHYSLLYPLKGTILIDLDKSITDAWDFVLTATRSEIMSLPCAELATGTRLDSLGLHPGAASLIGRWQRVGRNDCMTVSKWNNANSGLWSPKTREYIADASVHLQNLGWTIINGRYDILDFYSPADWFIDAPYQNVPGYKFDCRHLDYAKLREFCDSRVGQVIVCEQEGATWNDFEPLCEVTGFGNASSGKTRKKSKEAVRVTMQGMKQ